MISFYSLVLLNALLICLFSFLLLQKETKKESRNRLHRDFGFVPDQAFYAMRSILRTVTSALVLYS